MLQLPMPTYLGSMQHCDIMTMKSYCPAAKLSVCLAQLVDAMLHTSLKSHICVKPDALQFDSLFNKVDIFKTYGVGSLPASSDETMDALWQTPYMVQHAKRPIPQLTQGKQALMIILPVDRIT